MEGIFEELFGGFIRFLLRWPGALVRWTVTGFRKPFKEVFNDDGPINVVIGFVIAFSVFFWFSLFR